MKKYKVEIELLTDAIFGSGQAIPGFIDLEVLYDDNGLPYLKGKTLKGKLREEVQNIVDKIKIIKPKLDFGEHITQLFGKADGALIDSLKFSDCRLPIAVQTSIEWALEEKIFSKEQVLSALTDIVSFTSIDESGRAKKGSLRQFRIIKKGIRFVCQIETNRELGEIEQELLAAGLSSLKHIGSMESKGKGKVVATLYIDEQNMTNNLLQSLEGRVASA